ncbi:hypothetical protein [Pradoshia sp.]
MRVTRTQRHNKMKKKKVMKRGFLKIGVLLTLAICLYSVYPLSNWGENFSWASDSTNSESAATSSLAASTNQSTYKEAQGKVTGIADQHTIEVDIDGKATAFHCQGNTKCESVLKKLAVDDAIVLYYSQDKNGQNRIIDMAIIYTPKQGDLVQYIEAAYSGMADSHTIEVTLPKNNFAAYQIRGPLLNKKPNEKFASGDRVLLTGIKTSEGMIIWNMDRPQN